VDSTLKAAWAGPTALVFTAVLIVINGGATIRLVDGGFVIIDGDTYTVEDDTFGTLGDVETISDGVDGQATRATVTLLPPTSAAIATLSAATAQGSAVTIMQGAVDPATGLCIGTPEVLFLGELDYPRFQVGGTSYALIMECGTEEGRLLEPNMERKLSDAFHQTAWPGELGEEFATGLTRKIYWRANDPATAGIKGRQAKGFDRSASR